MQSIKISAFSVAKEEEVVNYAEWLAFGNKYSVKRRTFIKEITLISTIAVILLSDSLKLINGCPNDPDAELEIGECFKIIIDQREAQLLSNLKLKFLSIVDKYLHNHTEFVATTQETAIFNTIINLLSQEETVERRLKSDRGKALNLYQ